MNRALVDRLAQAMLYEGYVLYPYRPSVKNSQRWCFGGIYPKPWSDAQTGNDLNYMQTEILFAGTPAAKPRISARFLHLVDRTVGELPSIMDEMPPCGEPYFTPIPFLQVGSQSYQSWQEAEEREVDLGELLLSDLIQEPHRKSFFFENRRTVEPVRNDVQKIAAVLIRQQQAVRGTIEVTAAEVAEGLHTITVRITNQTDITMPSTRDEALMHSLVSTHTILGVDGGGFVSLTDPPEQWRDQARACTNVGAWPVLVGEEGQHDTILSSPIILSDYPQLAPESPGDLFDSTEIDEILTLRILTLTDAEKSAAAGVDIRVANLLARTESLARDQLMNLHGTMRGLQPVAQEQTHG
jgi:hypothetical protein